MRFQIFDSGIFGGGGGGGYRKVWQVFFFFFFKSNLNEFRGSTRVLELSTSKFVLRLFDYLILSGNF